MPSLRELQRAFAARLAQPGPEGGADIRMAIYRGNGRANYRGALPASYPVARRLTGAAFFHAAVDHFVAAHPPVSGDLNVYGDRFGDFLARYDAGV